MTPQLFGYMYGFSAESFYSKITILRKKGVDISDCYKVISRKAVITNPTRLKELLVEHTNFSPDIFTIVEKATSLWKEILMWDEILIKQHASEINALCGGVLGKIPYNVIYELLAMRITQRRAVKVVSAMEEYLKILLERDGE